MCDRKYNVHVWCHVYIWFKNGQTCPKKVNKKKYFCVHETRVNYPSFNVIFFLYFTYRQKLSHFSRNQVMKHTLFTICTLFNLKKLQGFLNITEYIIFLKKKLSHYLLTICYLYVYSSIRSLVKCKYRDSNMFGDHFRILTARMVQSVELEWTVLKRDLGPELEHAYGWFCQLCMNICTQMQIQQKAF